MGASRCSSRFREPFRCPVYGGTWLVAEHRCSCCPTGLQVSHALYVPLACRVGCPAPTAAPAAACPVHCAPQPALPAPCHAHHGVHLSRWRACALSRRVAQGRQLHRLQAQQLDPPAP
eukprot:156615-Pleurochrysis_carterae.AAC.1